MTKTSAADIFGASTGAGAAAVIIKSGSGMRGAVRGSGFGVAIRGPRMRGFEDASIR